MRKLKTNSRDRLSVSKKKGVREYSLQGTSLDLPTSVVLAYNQKKRHAFLQNLLDELAKEIAADRLSLKANVYFDEEMADLRRLLRAAPDRYVYADDKSRKRTVLGKGAPGATHIYWSLNQIWKMATKQGNLADQIKNKAPALVRKLDKLFDPTVKSKAGLRQKEMAIPCALGFLQFDKSSGSAFPPFHARFLADKYLPSNGDCIVFDPCAGWGGRLLGSLLVNRTGKVTYIGVDPEVANQPAYDGLTGRVTHWLKKEIAGPREAKLFYEPFEEFLELSEAKALHSKIDFALTSPPYFRAENYNPENEKQSANRYTQYTVWRDSFYRPLIAGVFDLLKPGGHFALNIADVQEAPTLERDARKLAAEVGFRSTGFYKLAMSISPAQRKAGTARHTVEVDGKLFKYEPVFIFRKPGGGEDV
jgi:hypothetical protein